MSGPGLFLSGDLDTLIERYIADRTATPDPLVRHTVVVPNAAVGQWFEQAVARRTGRDGGHDGVVANVDAIFASGLIAPVLYGDSRALERWSGEALALGLLEDERESSITVTDAVARGAVLERMMTHRADELDELVAGSTHDRERRLLARLRSADELWPAAKFARDGVAHPELVGPRVAVIGPLASLGSGLLCDVVRALCEHVRVDLYFAVASRELTQPLTQMEREDLSLMERWGAPTRAHLEQWRTRGAPHSETWIEPPRDDARDARLRAMTGASAESGAVSEPFLEVHRAVGLARQVEVARDAVLRALANAGLAPHQARIVTPDPTKVAPLLSLFFESDDDLDGVAPRLQFEVADPNVA